MDFCSLIINLLNNAVEGAKGENKYVTIRIEQDRYKLSICVSNPIEHVDAYDGEVFIQQKNNVFTIKLMVSNQ